MNLHRWLAVLFLVLIIVLQYPLWLGKGNWLEVWSLNRKIHQQEVTNEELRLRNSRLNAEVNDLKRGFAAIEERARSELGLIKPGEIFYQVIDPTPASPTNTTPASPLATTPPTTVPLPAKPSPDVPVSNKPPPGKP